MHAREDLALAVCPTGERRSADFPRRGKPAGTYEKLQSTWYKPSAL